MTSLACFRSQASSRKSVGGATSHPVAAASDSSSGPQTAITRRSPIRRATSPKRSGGHCLSGRPAPGTSTTESFSSRSLPEGSAAKGVKSTSGTRSIDGTGQGQVLFDDVQRGIDAHTPVEEDARRTLADGVTVEAVTDPCPRYPRQRRRLDQSLKVDRHVEAAHRGAGGEHLATRG